MSLEGREIKFRFVKDEKKVFYDLKELYDTDEWNENQTLEWFGYSLFFSMFSNIKRQQFTGSLDKNNKEIYEGDIVTLYREDGCFWVEYVEDEGTYYFLKYNNPSEDNKTFQDSSKDCREVVGNIYENKELLEESK